MDESYFDSKNNVKKLYAFYGNVKDLFIGKTLCPLTLVQMLHQELLMNGYQRIIFFDYGGGAYFLDQRSRRLWDPKAVADEDEDSIFLDIFQEDDGVELFQKEEEETDTSQILSIQLSAEEMLRNIGPLLLDVSIPTAVVFTNGTAALKLFVLLEHGQLLDDFLQKITQSTLISVNNRNTAIFLFEGDYDEVTNEPSLEQCRSFFQSKQLINHKIPLPDSFEVKRLLNYLHIEGYDGHKLQIDFCHLDEISRILARRLAYSCSEEKSSDGYKSLFELLGYLNRNYIQKKQKLSLDSCGGKESPMKKLDHMIGMGAVKECLNFILEMEPPTVMGGKSRLAICTDTQKREPLNLHFVLKGNPGVGKSTVAALIGEILGEKELLPIGHTVKVSPAELIGEYIGQSEKNIRDAIQRAMGGVLFIDEAYGLLSQDGKPNEYQNGIIVALTDAMTHYQGQLSVVAAGYPSLMDALIAANPGLESRFVNNIILEDYSPQELTDIFRLKAKDEEKEVADDVLGVLPKLFINWECKKKTVVISGGTPLTDGWGNGRQAENLYRECKAEKRRAKNIGMGNQITYADLPSKRLEFLEQHSAEDRLNQMVGLLNLKNELKKLKNEWLFGEMPEIKNFIFSGNPGTGKNAVAALIGEILRENGVLKVGHVVFIAARDLLNVDYMGLSARLNRVFELAKNGVLFIDEAYGLLDPQGQAAIDLLLKYTEKSTRPFPVCVICAGYPYAMEKFMRANDGFASRFSVIHFESYTCEELLEILRLTVAQENYTAEEGYYHAAAEYLHQHISRIEENENARFIHRFFKASGDCMRNRLSKRRDEGIQILEEEKRMLKKADCPNSFPLT